MNSSKEGGAKIGFALPALSKASGGLNTIFRYAEALESAGYDCTFFFPPSSRVIESESETADKIKEWYGYKAPLRIEPHAECIPEEFDLAIATFWATANFVSRQSCKKKAYFIQDWESWFYPVGSESLGAIASHHMGLSPITIGRWLAQKCENESGMPAYFTDFCADQGVYHTLECEKEEAICAIYQPQKPRRATELLLNSLTIVKRMKPEVKVFLYGSDEPSPETDFVNLGILTKEECNKLYNACLCGISMSTSNPSRLPYEMMASGLPVVDLYGEQTIYDLPQGSILLAKPTASAIAAAIIQFLENDNLRTKYSVQGMQFMAERTSDQEGLMFIKACKNLIKGTDIQRTKPSPLYNDDPVEESHQTRKIESEIEAEKDQKLINELKPLSITKEIYISYTPEQLKESNFSIAIWSDEGQSDLQWITGKHNPVSGGFEFVAHLNKPSTPEERVIFNFHIYQKNKSEEQQLVDCFSKTIILNRDVNEPATVKFKGKNGTLELQPLAVKTGSEKAEKGRLFASLTTLFKR